MSKVLIAIAIEDGKVKLEIKNIHANAGDIALSISILEMLKNKQVNNFEKLNNLKT